MNPDKPNIYGNSVIQKRSIEYKTNWDVAFSYLSKNNSYRVIAVNEDAQNKLTIKNMSDQSDLNLIGFENMNINSVGFCNFFLNRYHSNSLVFLFQIQFQNYRLSP